MKRNTIIPLSILVMWICCFEPLYAGEIRLYDANNQFIGITSPQQGGIISWSVPVFNPILNLFFDITIFEHYADIRSYSGDIYFDASGTKFINPTLSILLSIPCDNKYYKSTLSVVDSPSLVKWRNGNTCAEEPINWIYKNNSFLRLEEVSPDSFPFSLPFATPLRLEYSNIKGDVDFDGDVDGADLGTIAGEFGK